MHADGRNIIEYKCINPGCTETTYEYRYVEPSTDIYQPSNTVSACQNGNHNWSEWVERSVATCKYGGVSTRQCLMPGCGAVETMTSGVGEHKFIDIDVESTCTTLGYTCRKCCFCDKVTNKKSKKTYAEHKWTEWESLQKGTCYLKERDYRECTVCGKKEYQVLDIQHKQGKIYKKNGKFYYTCKSCKKEIEIDTPTYTIKLDYNDGKGTVKTQIMLYDGEPFTVSNETIPGFTLKYWECMQSNGSKAQYKPGTVIPQPSGYVATTITLKAKWKPIHYTVEFDLGYKASKKNLIAPISVQYGDVITLPTPKKRSNYNFVGWEGYLSSKNNKVINLATTEGAVVTLKAVWQRNDIKITYHGGGGTGTMADTYPSIDGNVLVVDECKFTRNDYVFVQWQDTRNKYGILETNILYPGDTITVNANLVDPYLIAQWAKKYPDVDPITDKINIPNDWVEKKLKSEYTSPCWEQIPGTDDYCIIHTEINSLGQYKSDMFSIGIKNKKLKLKEYTQSTGWNFKTAETLILENTSNVGGAFALLGCHLINNVVDEAVSDLVPFGIGKIVVTVKNGVILAAEVKEEKSAEPIGEEAGKYLFTKQVEDSIKFLPEQIVVAGKSIPIKSVVVAGKEIPLAGLAISEFFDICEISSDTWEAASQNLDPFGNRDVAVSTFIDNIGASTFPNSSDLCRALWQGDNCIIRKLYRI